MTRADPRATQDLVRNRVKEILTNSPAYRALSASQRRAVAHDMVKVARYLVDAGGQTADLPVTAVVQGGRPGLARAMLSPDDLSEDIPSGADEVAGSDFDPAAARAAADQGTEFIRKVDFPKFVAGLIDGVFKAIVDASIKQMEAYGELLKNVAKTVDEYMGDNITENEARDYLAERYPDHLEVDVSGQQPAVRARPDADQNALPDFFKDFGLPTPIDELDDETAEQVLVPAARRRMAMDRQQLLVAMMSMGMNRLVVTDGQIRASVLFRIDSRDSVERSFGKTASQYASHYDNKRTGGGIASWFGADSTYRSDYARVSVETSQSEDSESTLDMHARLKGDVNVNFRSETMPFERIAELFGGPSQPAGETEAGRS